MTISAEAGINSIMVAAIDGKVIYDRKVKSSNPALLDFAAFENRIYIISIETIDGKVTKKKVLKN